MKPNLVPLRGVAVTAVLVTALAGCGSSGGGKSGPTSSAATSGATGASSPAATSGGTATGAASADAAFCTTLGDYARKFKALSFDSDLAGIKKELPPLVDSGKSAAASAPAEIKSDVQALVGDIAALNQWIQTKATSKQLNGSSVPAEVAKPFGDLQQRLPKLQSWYSKNCKGTFGS